MPKYQAVRGTKDLLPPETTRFQRLENMARDVFGRFGFQEIRTPTFEALDLFQRSLGETTDVVQKEMYVFEDRGGRQLALRPEGTAGVVRAFVEHHLSQTHPFCKLFYIGPMFRAERPQAGRYREFWQIGAESFGNAAPSADAELLLLVQTLFDCLEVPGTLKMNSLGCDACRPKYLDALRAYIGARLEEFCDDCRRRFERNPLRALDCKTDRAKLEGAPTIDAFWDEPCRTHFQKVQELFASAGGRFQVTPRLVRGLDYYTRTVFEMTTNALGAQDALAAGGRYDRLVKEIGGPDTPALGFALGVERTLLAAEAASKALVPAAVAARVFVAAMGENAASAAFELLQRLRRDPALSAAGVQVEGGFFDKKLGAQLHIADRIQATHAIILGDDELKQGALTLKTLHSGQQESLAKDRLVPHLIGLNRHGQNPVD